MRIKHLFYLLLALPLVFAACEPDTPEQKIEKETVLTLTSASTMEFKAEGGKGVITFTAELKDVTRSEEPVPQPEVEATCEAAWIENLTVAENITFDVAANDSEARQTKVVVTYGDKSFEVAINQLAKEEEPTYVMDVNLAAAMRIPGDEIGLADNFFALEFADDAENIKLGIVLAGGADDTVLQAGEYSSDDETLLIDDCAMFIWEPAGEYTFTEGLVAVSKRGEEYQFDIELDNEDGLYHFDYQGVVLEMEPSPAPAPELFEPLVIIAYRVDTWDVGNFELAFYIDAYNYHSLDMQDMINPNTNYLSAGKYSMKDGSITGWSNFIANIATGEGAYVTDAEVELIHNGDGTTTVRGFMESEYGDHLDFDWTGAIDGFNFDAGNEPPAEDVTFNATYFAGSHYNVGIHNYYITLSNVEVTGELSTPGGIYYIFDIYSDEADDELNVPNGVYTFDIENSYASGTFTEEYGYGFTKDENNLPIWYMYGEGSTLTVTDDKIVADLILLDGTKHTVIYEGPHALGSVNTGGAEGDIEVEFTGASVLEEYYDQYYSNNTENWFIQIWENYDTGVGRYFLFDVLAPLGNDEDYSGTYTASNSYDASTFVPGYITEGALNGCWYAELHDNSDEDIYVPLTGGTINITLNEDGSHTFVVDCEDNQGNKVTGTVVGSPIVDSFAYSTSGDDSQHGLRLPKSQVIM